MRHLTSLKSLTQGSALLAALAVLTGCDRGITTPDLPWEAESVALTSAADFPGGIEGVSLADPRPSPIFILDEKYGKLVEAVEITLRVAEDVFRDGGKEWSFNTAIHLTGGLGNDYAVNPKVDPASAVDPKIDPTSPKGGTFLVVIAVPVDGAVAKALAAEGKTAGLELAVELYRQVDRSGARLMDRVEAAGIIMDID